MKKINTIQKRENLNEVFTIGEKGNGGAYHRYAISSHGYMKLDSGVYEVLDFQNGARDSEGAVEGIIDTDLLEIVRHRLECFQEGQFATMENDIALYHIETALLWMNKRVEDRIERNVLGIMKK